MARPEADSLSGFYPRVVQDAVRLFDHPDAVRQLDPETWDVLNLKTPSRRVVVRRLGDRLYCRRDKHGFNQDRPIANTSADQNARPHTLHHRA